MTITLLIIIFLRSNSHKKFIFVTYYANAMNDGIVIIPTYNEIENIETIVRAVFSLHKSFDILIVDDQDDIRLLIGGILNDEGLTTREAPNAPPAAATSSPTRNTSGSRAISSRMASMMAQQ